MLCLFLVLLISLFSALDKVAAPKSLGRAGDSSDRAVAVCHCEHSLHHSIPHGSGDALANVTITGAKGGCFS